MQKFNQSLDVVWKLASLAAIIVACISATRASEAAIAVHGEQIRVLQQNQADLKATVVEIEKTLHTIKELQIQLAVKAGITLR